MTMPKYTVYQGDEPPEFICLPDGRQFHTKDLLVKRRNYRSHRVGQKDPIPSRAGRHIKYSPEERQWMLGATVTEIQERYKLETRMQAWGVLRDTHAKLGLPPPSRRTWPK